MLIVIYPASGGQPNIIHWQWVPLATRKAFELSTKPIANELWTQRRKRGEVGRKREMAMTTNCYFCFTTRNSRFRDGFLTTKL